MSTSPSPSPSTPVPPHTLLESPTSRTIEISNWRITARTHPISAAPECDALHLSLGIPLPEMTFGSNLLTLEHIPSRWKYTWSTPAALGEVRNGEMREGDGGVKVGYADKWLQSRTDPSSTFVMPKTVAKPYDWTYTTTYAGHSEPWAPVDIDGHPIPDSDSDSPSLTSTTPEVSWTAADPEDSSHEIPMAQLTRQDPILFYAEIPLFEDELHDNGSSTLLVRIRVMPTCFFILSRFTLRVDNVLFRQFDTRFFHSFDSPPSSPPLIIRETSGWEAPYERVQRQLPRREDLTPLTDPSFIARALSEMPPRISQKEGAKTGWRGLGTKREVPKLALVSLLYNESES